MHLYQKNPQLEHILGAISRVQFRTYDWVPQADSFPQTLRSNCIGYALLIYAVLHGRPSVSDDGGF
jgi:hypothetical protein